MRFNHNKTSNLYQGQAPTAFIHVDLLVPRVAANYTVGEWTYSENVTKNAQGKYVFETESWRDVGRSMEFKDRRITAQNSKVLENKVQILSARGLPKEAKDLVKMILE